ncbi:hypothetical protein [Sphingomonas zeae]
MRVLFRAGAMALACCSAGVRAQSLPQIVPPSNIIPPAGVAFIGADGKSYIAAPATPLPVAGKQETVALASANTAVPAVALYGGTYILNQSCGAYGTVALRYRAADGSTMVTLLTRSVADVAGTAVQFGSGQVVDVALTGTTGCNVTLSRMP